jgi:hypothetical protein
MQTTQIRQYDMVRRVLQFLDMWATQLAAVAAIVATAAAEELVTIAQQMGANESQQASSKLAAKSETANQKSLNRDLRKHHMRPIATIAAAHLHDVPGFEALKMPPSSSKLAVVVQAATAMADAARPYQDMFVKNGRPANFADALVAAATAARASLDKRAASIQSKVAASGGLKANASRIHTVLGLLDAQVKSAVSDDPKALAAWKSAKRIGKGKVVPIEATTPLPASPVTPTTPTKA